MKSMDNTLDLRKSRSTREVAPLSVFPGYQCPKGRQITWMSASTPRGARGGDQNFGPPYAYSTVCMPHQSTSSVTTMQGPQSWASLPEYGSHMRSSCYFEPLYMEQNSYGDMQRVPTCVESRCVHGPGELRRRWAPMCNYCKQER